MRRVPAVRLAGQEAAAGAEQVAGRVLQPWVRFVTPYRVDSLALSVYGQLGRPELTAAADTAVDRLGDELPDGGVVVLGELASALLRGGDVDQGVYVSRQFAAAEQAKPNTMGKERASTIAASLPDSDQELGRYLRQFASSIPTRGRRVSSGRERRRTADPVLRRTGGFA